MFGHAYFGERFFPKTYFGPAGDVVLYPDVPASRLYTLPSQPKVLLWDPDDSVYFELDWNNYLSEGVTLSTVSHSLPDDLDLVSEATSSVEGRSAFMPSGGIAGHSYFIEASAVLSDASTVNLTYKVPLRCLDD